MAGFGAATTLEARVTAATACSSTPSGRSPAGSTAATCWRWPAGRRWPSWATGFPHPLVAERPLPRGARGRPGRADGARAAARPPHRADPGVAGHLGRSVRGGPGHLRAARPGASRSSTACPAPQLPPEADCPRLPVEGPGFTVPLLAVVAERLDPATMGWAVGKPSGQRRAARVPAVRRRARAGPGRAARGRRRAAAGDVRPRRDRLGADPRAHLPRARRRRRPARSWSASGPGWSAAAGSTRSATSGTRPVGWSQPGTSWPAYGTRERRQRRDAADLRAGGAALSRAVRPDCHGRRPHRPRDGARTRGCPRARDRQRAGRRRGRARGARLPGAPHRRHCGLRRDAAGAGSRCRPARRPHRRHRRPVRRGVRAGRAAAHRPGRAPSCAGPARGRGPAGRAARHHASRRATATSGAATRSSCRGTSSSGGRSRCAPRCPSAGWEPVVVDHLETPHGPWLVSLSRRREA